MLSNFKRDDLDIYVDYFDIKKLDTSGKMEEKDYKKLSNSYVKEIYEKSINSVQLFQAIKLWGWYAIEDNDTAREFIVNYDLNGDGRLSPREYILAVIMHHKNRKVLCHNCFLLVKKKLEAVFQYFDCLNRGYLTAEELWNRLPRLSRKDKRWNIFSFDNSDNIRTDAINDFVIKNSQARDGGLTKEEFVNGVLLGIWDRQTSDSDILFDDSRNLKELRWKDGGMIDTVAFEYIKDAEIAKIVADAQVQREKNRNAAISEGEKRRKAFT
jgi:hypothetical protein